MSAMGELILNVDDNDANRYVKSRILIGAGFQVVEAATGAAMRRLIAERSPDLVLLDVKLPDANGRALCIEIKADPETAQVVVLQTSASHADTANRVASLEAGADGYLVYPIEPEAPRTSVDPFAGCGRRAKEKSGGSNLCFIPARPVLPDQVPEAIMPGTGKRRTFGSSRVDHSRAAEPLSIRTGNPPRIYATAVARPRRSVARAPAALDVKPNGGAEHRSERARNARQRGAQRPTHSPAVSRGEMARPAGLEPTTFRSAT